MPLLPETSPLPPETDRRGHLPVEFRALAIRLTGVAIALFVFAGFAGAHSNPAHTSPAQIAVAGIPTHVETWAYDDGCTGGVGARPALVRQWVTFAESQCGFKSKKALRDCRANGTTYCAAMQYLDPDWNFGIEDVHIRGSSANWWLHEPSHPRTRIFSNSFRGGHLLNQTTRAVQAFFQSYARRHYDAYTGLLLDWQSSSLPQELYYSSCHCTTTHEIRSNRELMTGHEEMSAALTHKGGAPFIQADNALPANPYLPEPFKLLNRSTGVDGLVAEGLPESYGNLDPYYSTLLDQIAYVATRTEDFVVPMGRAAAGDPRSRRVQEATILLGYSPGHIVDWANLETNSSHLAVWPEEAIYPTDPVESMAAPGGRGCLAGTGDVCSTGGHNDVQVAPGVYRREFGECYRAGNPFGACAAIINTTGRRVRIRSSWLSRPYGHRITFRGGDVQSKGSIDLSGARFTAGSTRLAPHDGMLLTP
jgi:hypothetical protein